MNTTRIRACLLAVALAAGACAGDDDASPDVTVDPTESSTTTTSMAESTTTTEDPRVAVEQAFFDQWDAYLEIVGDPDVSNPLIEQTYTGGARDEILDAVSRLLAEGTVIVPPEDPTDFVPRVLDVQRVSQDEYVVFQCTRQGLVLKDRATGSTLDDAVADYNRRSTYVAVDGRWKVQSTTRFQPGDPTCDGL